MKKEILKIANCKTQKEFYQKFPTEQDFLRVYSKEFKKALRGASIKKAQMGTNQGAYNQQNAGINNMAATQADVQEAISNLSTGTPKKTTGQSIAEGVSDIPVLGSLVSGIVGLFDAGAERKRQVRAGKLSDLQLAASQSAPRPENRKYNRPDLDNNVADINSLMPAEGTGTNLLGRDGLIVSKNGEVPQADIGGILSSLLSKGGSSGSGGGIMGMISGLLSNAGGGGQQTTVETTTLDPSQYVIRNRPSQSFIPQAQAGDWITKILGSQNGEGQGSNVAGMIGSLLNSNGGKSINSGSSPIKSTGTMSFNADAIPGMNTKMSQSSKQIGEAVGGVIPLPGASQVLGLVAQGIGAIAEDKSGQKALKKIERNTNQMASTQAAKTMQSNQQSFVRTGGNIRQNNSPDMEQTGELKTLWGGHAEPISYNPYLGEETVMFKGNSHDESDGRGRTGIGVRYGEGGDLQPYNANVEVEKGEPAVQMLDETGEKNLVVYGNLPIPNQFVNMLGDPNAKGKKFKNYISLLSKDENKQNKIIEKAVDDLTSFTPKTPYERIKFDTLSLTINGANQKLKNIAEKKKNAAHLQQAIHEEADERQLDPEQLVKGKIKAMKGAKVPKAQEGYEDFLKKKNEGAPYNNDTISNSLSTDFVQRIGNLTVNEKPGFIPQMAQSYLSEQQDKGQGYYSLKEEMQKPTDAQIVGTNANVERPSSYPPINDLPDFGDLPRVSRENYILLKGLYDKALKTNSKSDILAFQETYNKLAPEYASKIMSKYPQTNHGKSNKLSKDDLKNLPDGRMGERTIQEMAALNQNDIPRMTPIQSKGLDLPERKFNDSYFDKKKKKNEKEKEKGNFPDLSNLLSPYLPSNKEELDPRQLTGEYYALATNQLEPVPAQQYYPDLKTPYEISLQDILNENVAATRGAQRFMEYNPAAQSNLLAQQYNANQKVLGEQFRINQEAKNRVYDENRNTLNDARWKNLGILDTQYQRQAKALSNTKDVAREALASISDKYMRNKLENRTLGTYENLYNYRYDDNQHAWNMNGPAKWNMQGNSTSGWEGLTEDEKIRYTKQQELEEAKKKLKKEQGRNGAILKAMRNI